MGLCRDLEFVSFEIVIGIFDHPSNLFKLLKFNRKIMRATQNYSDLIYTWELVQYLVYVHPLVHVLNHLFLHADALMPFRTKFYIIGVVLS